MFFSNSDKTAVNQKFEFETSEFSVPSYPGWYTVNAKISDRFDQTWFEWSFQFQVDENTCTDCQGNRTEYIQQLRQNIDDYKNKISDIKYQRDERRSLMYLYSFEQDPDERFRYF